MRHRRRLAITGAGLRAVVAAVAILACTKTSADQCTSDTECERILGARPGEARCAAGTCEAKTPLADAGGVEDAVQERRKTPKEYCFDLVEVIARAAERCNYDYEVYRQQFAETLQCAIIDGIRDPVAFVEQCIPGFQKLTCKEVDDPNTPPPPGCEEQLLSSKFEAGTDSGRD